MVGYKSKLTTSQMALLLVLCSHTREDVDNNDLFRLEPEYKGLLDAGLIETYGTWYSLTDKGKDLFGRVMETPQVEESSAPEELWGYKIGDKFRWHGDVSEWEVSVIEKDCLRATPTSKSTGASLTGFFAHDLPRMTKVEAAVPSSAIVVYDSLMAVTDEYPEGKHWRNEDNGALTILGHDGQRIAEHAAGTWRKVARR